MKRSVRINIKRTVLYLLIILIAVVAKLIVFYILPSKFFFDSNAIMQLMQHEMPLKLGASYNNTAWLFNRINFWDFLTLTQWHIFAGVIYTLVLILLIRKYEITGMINYAWLFMSVGILNIFAFNLSKEFWQFAVFLIIALIIQRNTKINTVFIAVAILILWGIFYRIYFILIGAYTVLAYCLFKVFKGSRKNKTLLVFFLLIFGVMCSLIIARIFSPADYFEIISIRSKVNAGRVGSEDARTLILSVFQYNDSLWNYMLNYTINLVRLLFPFELLRGELYYYLFLVYQLIITLKIFMLIKSEIKGENDKSRHAALCVYCGFFLGSALFEPDFGSWVRHGAVLFPILVIGFWERKVIKNDS